MNIKIHQASPSCELLAALEVETFQYTTPKTIFHLVWLTSETYVGVVGDGDNGSYEWFVWEHDKLHCSNCGYGSTGVALRDGLKEVNL